MKTVEEENEIERVKHVAMLRDRARIFREVFDNTRGQLVIEYLAKNFGTLTGFPPNQLDMQGRTDALQTWRKLGHFDVIQYIKYQLEFKESEHVDPSLPSP